MVSVQQNPLARSQQAWRECSAHPWVLSTVTKGYRLQFAGKPPPFNGVIASVAKGDSARVLETEISSLLEKRAIRRVPVGETQKGYYSRYFLIPKKDGGLRPTLDLRVLNKHLRKYKFRMLTVAALTRAIRRDDWFTAIDLKDAYFHISIYPAHRKYLRFSFQSEVYEFVTLPFGLSLAPRVFTKCMETALSPLRRRGLRIYAYLDDYLICAHSRERAERDTEMLTSHLMNLGFRINYAKSQLIPSREIKYLGLRIDSVAYRTMLSERRIIAFYQCLALFRLGNLVSFRTCLRLLGMMASLLAVVPLGLLKMRDFQRWVAARGLCSCRHLTRRVRIHEECVAALRQWRDPSLLRTGVPLGGVSLRKVVTTNASLSGWGAVFQGRSVNGRWTPQLGELYINMLELMAVFLALKHFLPFLEGFHVLVRTDNTTVVAYINRQGGTRSLQLHNLARKLIVWSAAHFSSLRATHVPGVLNMGADLLSRGNPLYGEWVLHPQVMDQIWGIYGRAAVDLFASRENAKCPLYFSLRDENAPLGVDALAHPWPNVLLYAFPPLSLISPTLERVRENALSLLLIAPHWPGRPWLAEIVQLLQGEPWPLPLRRDLLSQAGGKNFHPQPERVNLWVWHMKG
ncbi:kinesin-like protein KIF6 isoform X3 [Misgurnus anguillicaudatus]|uniref:kinesin-like protein KIF6 isoform X3 n=1 Tax=Misgurnus anguillicaudatus TaxID=75329 RepID=UPI003CCFD3C6